MTYEICRYIFFGGLVACGVFFIIAAILFFAFKIPKVISDLSGRTAKKAIENIRMQNEASGDKAYKSSAVNLERGKITDKISKSGRLIKHPETPFGTGKITEKISTQKLDTANETTVLSASETTVLSASETTVLSAPAGETDVLMPEMGETAVLSAAQPAVPVTQAAQAFAVEHEITYIHTNEVIS